MKTLISLLEISLVHMLMCPPNKNLENAISIQTEVIKKMKRLYNHVADGGSSETFVLKDFLDFFHEYTERFPEQTVRLLDDDYIKMYQNIDRMITELLMTKENA